MGSLYNGVCYPAVEQAEAAACSAFHGSFADPGIGLSSWFCESVTDHVMNMYFLQGSYGNTGQIPVQAFPECDYSGGVMLGMDWLYLVLPVVIALWALRRIMSLFSQE